MIRLKKHKSLKKRGKRFTYFFDLIKGEKHIVYALKADLDARALKIVRKKYPEAEILRKAKI